MFQNGNKPSAPAHVLALALVGGYLLYMAINMISNVQTGSSSMSMTTALILAAVMAAAGLGVLGYGVWLFRAAQKDQENNQDEHPENPND